MKASKTVLLLVAMFCVALSSQSKAANFQVACTALSVINGPTPQRLTFRVNVNSSIATPGSLAEENNIIYSSYYPCRDLAQAQLDAISCSKVALGSTDYFTIGYYTNGVGYSAVAFYGDRYLSYTNYALSGIIYKSKCPYVDPCAKLPAYKQAQCRGLDY